MGQLDVKDLASEHLPAGKFPASPRADFRLHISPEVRRNIEQHAKADVSVEICGVLVGNWFEDENGPFVDVTNYIRCDNASSKFAEVTFTHESWAQINKAMDSQFKDSRIVGWYHSHPDFGIFLSDRDCFIHEHFFSGPGQVAYVIDPVRGLEGMFAWRGGKPMPLSHFWVGNNIRTVEASQRNEGAEMAAKSVAGRGSGQQYNEPPTYTRGSTLGFAMTALGLIALFYLGYLYGGWQSRWQQQMIIEGAVAHFADTKLIREGLETDLTGVRLRLDALTQELDKLPEPGTEVTNEQREEAIRRRKTIRDNLELSSKALERTEKAYGLSDIERAILARIAAAKQAELRRMEEAAAAQSKGGTKSGQASSNLDQVSPPSGNSPGQKPPVPTPADQPPANAPANRK
jgi:proteasome lid subunit RPN8/RPN11